MVQPPTFIGHLLDQSQAFRCYVVVGDPSTGDYERIGFEPQMLQAHSLVMRTVLDQADSEADERWDVPLPFIRPKIFRYILILTYGYDCLPTIPFSELIEVISAVHQLSMPHLENCSVSCALSQMKCENVVFVLTQPLCLRIPSILQTLRKFLINNMREITSSGHFPSISPEFMRYIVEIRQGFSTATQLWEMVVDWAKRKVLTDGFPVSLDAERLRKPKCIIPPSDIKKLCTEELIKIVDDLHHNEHPENNVREETCTLISHFHTVSTNPSEKILVCLKKGQKKPALVHREFFLKKIHNQSHWSDSVLKSTSEISITTSENSCGLYSLVCAGIYKYTQSEEEFDWPLEQRYPDKHNTYTNQCTVSTTKYSKNTKEFEVVSDLTISQELTYDEDFHIPFGGYAGLFELQPHSTYKMTITFSSPHPAWNSNEPEENMKNENGISVTSKFDGGYGTHVKYILFDHM